MTTDIPDWIADAHRGNGKRFVVHADELLTAFVELESAIRSGERPEDCGARKICCLTSAIFPYKRRIQ